jgi:hypothetical protein
VVLSFSSLLIWDLDLDSRWLWVSPSTQTLRRLDAQRIIALLNDTVDLTRGEILLHDARQLVA